MSKEAPDPYMAACPGHLVYPQAVQPCHSCPPVLECRGLPLLLLAPFPAPGNSPLPCEPISLMAAGGSQGAHMCHRVPQSWARYHFAPQETGSPALLENLSLTLLSQETADVGAHSPTPAILLGEAGGTPRWLPPSVNCTITCRGALVTCRAIVVCWGFSLHPQEQTRHQPPLWLSATWGRTGASLLA